LVAGSLGSRSELGESLQADTQASSSQAYEAQSDEPLDPRLAKEIQSLLAELPEDVRRELNLGQIEVDDPAFLEGLTDHVSRLALANPRIGRKLLGKLRRLQTSVRRTVREVDPDVKTSDTIQRESPRVGRNAPCPCGSGRKFKQCCLRLE
jgi:hypothetical protein